MTELPIASSEARDNFTHIVACATWGSTRLVIHRYGVEMAALVGPADLLYLRERDRKSGSPQEAAADPAPPLEPGTYEWMKDLYERGETVPTARTPEESKAQLRLAMEIGERLMAEKV